MIATSPDSSCTGVVFSSIFVPEKILIGIASLRLRKKFVQKFDLLDHQLLFRSLELDSITKAKWHIFNPKIYENKPVSMEKYFLQLTKTIEMVYPTAASHKAR